MLPIGKVLATKTFVIVRVQAFMRPSVLRLLSQATPASTIHADHWYAESPAI